MAILSFALARSGELTVRQLVPALLIGAGGTAIALLVVGGPSALVQHASLNTNLGIELQSAFAYLSAMAFVVSYAWALSDADGWVGRELRWVSVVFFGSMTLLSYTRGAWLAALIGLVYVPRRAGKPRLAWLALLLLVVVVLALPVGRERLLFDIGEGGLGSAISSGQLGTGRLGLWEAMLEEARTEPVFGHGFGFTFSQGSVDSFGSKGTSGLDLSCTRTTICCSGRWSSESSALPCTQASGLRCGRNTVGSSPIPMRQCETTRCS